MAGPSMKSLLAIEDSWCLYEVIATFSRIIDRDPKYIAMTSEPYFI